MYLDVEVHLAYTLKRKKENHVRYLSFIVCALVFANELKSKFPNYDLKILKFITTVFVRCRIKHINALREKEKREKREAKAAAKKRKEEEKAARERKEEESEDDESEDEETDEESESEEETEEEKKEKTDREEKEKRWRSTATMCLRSRMKIGQFAQ